MGNANGREEEEEEEEEIEVEGGVERSNVVNGQVDYGMRVVASSDSMERSQSPFPNLFSPQVKFIYFSLLSLLISLAASLNDCSSCVIMEGLFLLTLRNEMFWG